MDRQGDHRPFDLDTGQQFENVKAGSSYDSGLVILDARSRRKALNHVAGCVQFPIRSNLSLLAAERLFKCSLRREIVLVRSDAYCHLSCLLCCPAA